MAKEGTPHHNYDDDDHDDQDEDGNDDGGHDEDGNDDGGVFGRRGEPLPQIALCSPS